MERRFGIELEITGIRQDRAAAALRAVGLSVVLPGYTHAVTREWKIVPDGSVPNGFEVVSPILEGEPGLAEAATAIDALKAAGSGADRSCGLHVHLEQSDLSVNEIRSVIRRYADFESQIDAFMPASRRGDHNRYCRSVRGMAERHLFREARTARELVRTQVDRFFKVNLHSLQRHGTVEFRQHNGIVDADRAVHWIRFLDAFVTESARIAHIPEAARPAAPVAAPRAPRAAANGRMTLGQRRVFDLIRQPGGATIEAVAARCGIQIHSARAVVTRIRQGGYTVRLNQVDGETRYEVAGEAPAAAAPAPAPAPAPTEPAVRADSLWAGVDAAVAAFYRNRAAVLALG